MGQFDGRVVVVTGSSNGIGRATAQLFAREGAMLIICGRNEKALNESKSIVLAENGNAENKVLLVSGDIREEAVMKKTIDETVQKFGRLDVLVNNAGGSSTTALEGSELDGDLSNYDYAMDLNTKSVLRLCQLAFPHLIKTKGEIVNVSSIAGLENGATLGFPFYTIAKAAQDQLTRNLAIYYITKGVRVNSVNPGAISTNIMQKHGFTDEMVKKATLIGTLRPLATPTCLNSYGTKHKYTIYYGLTPFELKDGRDGRREYANQSRLSPPPSLPMIHTLSSAAYNSLGGHLHTTALRPLRAAATRLPCPQLALKDPGARAVISAALD
ncbi:hypothetical protein Y032_0019g3886 [Ancylostoma ceylanicum]|uniref:Oxidoreductase, short chain dehydrogenase/reductase family protein n=1 Tax=Ancylostoma ceylanicum TaxID=53326 RepID=A0A016V2U2_9BILA|nr:hypothetical protein Y032_0019g3886 [Ancylostoma ceylanicum]